MGGAGHPSVSPAVGSDGVGPARKRTTAMAGLDSSPGSIDDVEGQENHEEKKRQPVKRACNECRQQKLRCDVIQDPWTDCSRCRRLKLDCKIESNFKRVGKRSRNAEMEREIIELRKQIATVQASTPGSMSQPQPPSLPPAQTPKQETASQVGSGVYHTPSAMSTDQYMGSHEAVASLLDLRSGFDGTNYMRNGNHHFKRIEDVAVVPERVTELFNLFFTFYHPFLPFLDREQTPDEYYNASPLLFWTIISVGARRFQGDTHLLNSLSGPVSRLVWSTLADIPQSYHVVKALCLLCTWPFPTSSTSTDPTFMLCGMMIQVAMQLGLHRPSHTQDFSKFRVELIEEELRDKVRTWAVSNIVAQRVATGYGQPPSTVYDWTLSSNESMDPNFRLPHDIRPRLEIEKFCDKVTKSLYTNRRDPVGLCSDQERSTLISFLSRDFDELENQLKAQNDCITNLYLRASNLHLHLSAFFDDTTAKDYRERLLSLYVATTSFLEAAMNLETEVGPVLPYTPYYVYQMMVAGGCTLLKLCKSFFAAHIDMDYAKNLFNRTIWAIRGVSVSSNDLPERLAEVVAQMWRLNNVPTPKLTADGGEVDDSLMLKVRCRMSMSLLFDSVWRWREDARTKGRNIEAYLKNPTNPDSNADSSNSSSVVPTRTSTATPGVAGADPSLAPAPMLAPANMAVPPSGGVGALPSGFLEPNYEVFDPLNWLLDGLVDLPYSYSTISGMESQGIA
ncbi:C6 transcription factor [Aspergillus sclerotioniger CBS 115572]|uniref:C6 transcription factor n=1 Tax=Aspergillus sclerotioniger CBS 115572 TaxID=1450535 RepID=A0A317VIK8_9EURO|nr:C6 transcription factor [Aspergillus sclerotioniger CBS 115572]PWY73755.1 C6 transcription factor [Aspergillus sclerotioniger CBS 115572]